MSYLVLVRPFVWLCCVLVLFAALLAGCSGESPSQGAAPLATESVTPVSLSLQRVFPTLSFTRLVGLYALPDGSAWLALEQRGRVLRFENRSDVSQAPVLLDLTDRVNAAGSEEGLLGLALAPDFAASGVFYVNYTAQNPRRTVISRFRLQNGAVDRDAEQVILEVGQPFANHNGGQIVFGPDGYLYIGMGDGGSARDPQGNGQNLGVLLGKMLRIDVSGAAAGLAYRVPADNPFVGRSGARGEVWAYGLRNPWRFSFDSDNGDLWVADVGQNAFEEIDIVRKGGNYGWAVMEASQCLGSGACNREGLELPVYEYATGANCAAVGGSVYRGKTIAALQGVYIFGDYCSGKVWQLRRGANSLIVGDLLDAPFNLSSFAVDTEGELYLLAHGDSGGIFKLVGR